MRTKRLICIVLSSVLLLSSCTIDEKPTTTSASDNSLIEFIQPNESSEQFVEYLDKTMFALYDDTPLYVEESLDSQVIDTLEKGEAVNLLASNDKFGMIRKENGLLGYVPLEMLSETDPTEISVTTGLTSETTTIEVTFETTTKEITEATTTAHETVHYLKQVELVDGVLPDGEYRIAVINLDDDFQGADFWVSAYWTIPNDELDTYLDGDTVVIAGTSYTYEITEHGEHRICDKNGPWYDVAYIVEGYIEDINEPWYYWLYNISESLHIYLEPNIKIYGDGVTYKSLSDLWQDILDTREYAKTHNYEYADVYNVSAKAIIKDGKVVEMFLNPEQHELWMPCELYYQKYGGPPYDSEGSIIPYSSENVIHDDVIASLSNEEIRYAINEIWARHGYIFRNQEILAYYRQFEWYVESVPADEWDKNGQNYYLNSIEQTNIEKLVKERDRRS